MRTVLAFAVVLSVAACSQEATVGNGEPDAVPGSVTATTVIPAPTATPKPAPSFPAGNWEMVSSGEGDGLFFGAFEGEVAAVHLFCASNGGLLVNVQAFRPDRPGDRMRVGPGNEAATFEVDPAGDANRGGISGEGAVPAGLDAILAASDGVTVSYGRQRAGPFPPVPTETARAFATGCTD
ncbi:hypothetical protein [Tsuneonella amylolytica]|uniref:hypothetical protein n=1 Tax=Tsuneonella amylolytica TaxID=2338327 RepID=UPI0013C41A2A|nr:hypothetical protein [Tsuneonella amylolytica]